MAPAESSSAAPPENDQLVAISALYIATAFSQSEVSQTRRIDLDEDAGPP
jgi:hypothetical protein